MASTSTGRTVRLEGQFQCPLAEEDMGHYLLRWHHLLRGPNRSIYDVRYHHKPRLPLSTIWKLQPETSTMVNVDGVCTYHIPSIVTVPGAAELETVPTRRYLYGIRELPPYSQLELDGSEPATTPFVFLSIPPGRSYPADQLIQRLRDVRVLDLLCDAGTWTELWPRLWSETNVDQVVRGGSSRIRCAEGYQREDHRKPIPYTEYYLQTSTRRGKRQLIIFQCSGVYGPGWETPPQVVLCHVRADPLWCYHQLPHHRREEYSDWTLWTAPSTAKRPTESYLADN